MSADSSPPTATRTVVHLLRHGEVENPGRVLYGRLPDFHLSALGHEMAQLAADHLATRDITHLVSSPLERAQETTAPLAQALNLDVTLDDRVIEAANDFEGLAVAGGKGIARHPSLYWKLRNPARPTWGEPYDRIAARMKLAIADARAAARGHEAVIVSHQAPIWAVRRSLQGKGFLHDPRKRRCSLCSVTSLSYHGDNLIDITYTEPAAALLPLAHSGAGA